MATSPEAFRQVKNILQKLDKSIEAARDRRLTGKLRAAGPTPAGAPAGDPPHIRAKPLPPRNDPNRDFVRPGDSGSR